MIIMIIMIIKIIITINNDNNSNKNKNNRFQIEKVRRKTNEEHATMIIDFGKTRCVFSVWILSSMFLFFPLFISTEVCKCKYHAHTTLLERWVDINARHRASYFSLLGLHLLLLKIVWTNTATQPHTFSSTDLTSMPGTRETPKNPARMFERASSCGGLLGIEISR